MIVPKTKRKPAVKPAPARRSSSRISLARLHQFNVRFSAPELATVRENATYYGYRTVSDYIRAVALKLGVVDA